VARGSGINHLLGIAMSLRTALSRINNAYRNQVNRTFETQKVVLAVCVLSTLLVCGAFAYQTSLIPSSRLISPDELAKILQSSKGKTPLMIQVGSHVLYSQAHIPGSEYIGPLLRTVSSDCANASNPCLGTGSLLSIVDVAPGAIAPTLSRRMMRCVRWPSAT
jgi:hypothetical protein